ncbi:MAG: proton-conducting transporter membrane subunit, partial [Actinomycetota bacterium]|nr:proton-conducting transporter membrane subunit [Actinomycetota bacterium]
MGFAPAFPVLPALLVIPAVGAALVAVLPRRRPEVVKQVAMLFSTATAGIAFWVLGAFETGPGAAAFQFTAHQPWIGDLGIAWNFGVDGISLFLVVLTALLFPIALMAVDPGHDEPSYFAWMLLLEAGVMGVFCVLDLVVFFLCFEVVLVPMYFLIGRWGHNNRTYAATKFFLFTMAGSALMLVGILAVGFLHAGATGDPVTFDLVTIAESQSLATGEARWLFATFALAFAVKVPIVP